MNYCIEKLGSLLQDASRKVWGRFEQRTVSYGLSAAQWRLLGAFESILGMILLGWSTSFFFRMLGRIDAH